MQCYVIIVIQALNKHPVILDYFQFRNDQSFIPIYKKNIKTTSSGLHLVIQISQTFFNCPTMPSHKLLKLSF